MYIEEILYFLFFDVDLFILLQLKSSTVHIRSSVTLLLMLVYRSTD